VVTDSANERASQRLTVPAWYRQKCDAVSRAVWRNQLTDNEPGPLIDLWHAGLVPARTRPATHGSSDGGARRGGRRKCAPLNGGGRRVPRCYRAERRANQPRSVPFTQAIMLRGRKMKRMILLTQRPSTSPQSSHVAAGPASIVAQSVTIPITPRQPHSETKMARFEVVLKAYERPPANRKAAPPNASTNVAESNADSRNDRIFAI
jgi:hypothetical protein